MNLGVISYVPTRASLHPDAFLKNLEAYKMRYPIHFYSDGLVGGCTIRIDNAEVLKGHRNKVALNNYLFLRGLQVAMEHGLDRFLFLETDVRVGCDDWDGKIFDEADRHRDIICAGTPCVWNASEMPPEMRASVNQYVADYKRVSGFSPPAFHSRTREFQTRAGNHCLFIMGAGAVYDTKAMEAIFHKAFGNPMEFACQIQAFDLHIGLWCARTYGSACVEKMPWLRSMFSTYKGKIMKDDQLIGLLREGRASLIHQVKSSDPCVFQVL